MIDMLIFFSFRFKISRNPIWSGRQKLTVILKHCVILSTNQSNKLTSWAWIWLIWMSKVCVEWWMAV